MTITERSSLSGSVREQLTRLLGDKVGFDEPLARHCSLGTGGAADALCTVGHVDTLRRLLSLLASCRVRWLIIGRGTNLLPADLGFRGVAVKLDGEFNHVAIDGVSLTAGAAVALASLVERAMSRDLGGLEFTTGIPGCVGGSLATAKLKHINIDVFTRLIPDKFRPARRWVVYGATGAAAFVLGIAALGLVINERAFGDVAFLSVQVWVLQTVLPITFFLIAYRSFVNLLLGRESEILGDK